METAKKKSELISMIINSARKAAEEYYNEEINKYKIKSD